MQCVLRIAIKSRETFRSGEYIGCCQAFDMCRRVSLPAVLPVGSTIWFHEDLAAPIREWDYWFDKDGNGTLAANLGDFEVATITGAEQAKQDFVASGWVHDNGDNDLVLDEPTFLAGLDKALGR